MWTDEKNALEHLIDLKRVKARIETEAQQEEKAGQIHTTAEQKEYRLKVLDKFGKVDWFVTSSCKVIDSGI